MPEKPFRASLLAGDRALGEVQGAMEEVTEGGVTAWRGHFEWPVSPGLLMAANDLRLEFPESEGGPGHVHQCPHLAARLRRPAPLPVRFPERGVSLADR